MAELVALAVLFAVVAGAAGWDQARRDPDRWGDIIGCPGCGTQRCTCGDMGPSECGTYHE